MDAWAENRKKVAISKLSKRPFRSGLQDHDPSFIVTKSASNCGAFVADSAIKNEFELDRNKLRGGCWNEQTLHIRPKLRIANLYDRNSHFQTTVPLSICRSIVSRDRDGASVNITNENTSSWIGLETRVDTWSLRRRNGYLNLPTIVVWNQIFRWIAGCFL